MATKQSRTAKAKENGNLGQEQAQAEQSITLKLAPIEAQFMMDVLDTYPHRGNRQYLAPILAMSEHILIKLQAASQGSATKE